jgi:hypothetical protein
MNRIKKYLHQIFYTRKVKILKCDNPFSWYYKRIGETYIVENCKKEYWMINDNWKTDYITVDKINFGHRGYIKKSDVKTYFNF